MNKRSVGLFVGASLLITLLSGSFLFLAPIPARHLHINHGRWAYWAFALLSSAVLALLTPQWAATQAAVLILIGIFTELEDHNISSFYSGLISMTLTAVLVFFMVLVWGKWTGVSTLVALKNHVTDIVTQYNGIRGTQEPDLSAATLLSLMPAIFSSVLMLMLFVGSVFVRTVHSAKAIQFRVPAPFIWVLIGSLAGTFLVDPVKQFYIQKTLSNILFLALAAYYFQGLAIMGFYFRKLRINYFLRTALFFVISVHLFIFVAGLGLSDLWIDYRSRGYKTRVKSE